MISKDQAYIEIEDLTKRFEEQFDSYKKSAYNETLTRRDFIDPFFSALGWDMNNSQGFAEAYREVIHEDKIKISGAVKAPDYSFRLSGGKRLFFVEAKKPHIVVKDEIIPAYQIRRYGWSAKLPISIITDFEEFAVYDCTKKPLPADKASVARIQYLNFKDYLKEFDFIYDTFSKEKVLKGSFDKFVASTANKKGTTTVDKEFLNSLDEWRTYLATSISWNNKDLDEDEINFVVQQTIDRLIFLRIAEDRSVEPYGNLKHSIATGDYYKNLFGIFQQADEKYNSGIFDFKKDKISKNIKVDNKVIKTIINELYYPESPYEFSVLSVEILGSAYEQFLGKQIRIDSAHRAKIEEKPEVRKAGGVYYTPQYIVDYIVKNTVGKLIDGKTPKDISDITIADIACGSGSFLLGAYQYLLDYHKDYYTRNGPSSKGKKDNPLTPEGHLTTAEKKRILLNNIYGVDIDVNAVEVTKLSLLLKCMEGETEASIASQTALWNERVLPTLDNNIKSGNSLIDVDYYQGKLDFGEDKKVKPFHWQDEFIQVFKRGGFDIIIGNPPYVLVGPDLFPPEEITYFERFSVAQYKVDLYHLFIERANNLVKANGRVGYIVPSTWMTQHFTDRIRRYILSNSIITEIFHLDYKVFEQADVYTELLFLIKNNDNEKNKIQFYRTENSDLSNPYNTTKSQITFLKKEGFIIDIRSTTPQGELVAKIISANKPLTQYARASLGCQAYNSSKHTKTQIKNRVFHSDKKLSKEYLEELAGSDVGRYHLERKKGQWIKYGEWLHDYRTMDWLTGERILVREITGKYPNAIQAVFTDKTYCNYKTILNVSPSEATNFSMRYLCGVLNSKLLSFIFYHSSNKIGANTFPRISVGDLKKMPLVDINLNDNTQRKIHDEIATNATMLQGFYKEIETLTLESQKLGINRKIEFTEKRINEIVYQLYNLTPDEIKIVEGQNDSVEQKG